MRSALVILAILVMTATGLGLPETRRERWRVTVEVETPAGLRTGAGVVETHSRQPVEGLELIDVGAFRVEGDAVAVQLPSGDLYALLSDGAYGIARYAKDCRLVQLHAQRAALEGVPPQAEIWNRLTPDRQAVADRCYARRAAAAAARDRALAEGRPFELIEDYWPRFVRFRDPADPGSVVEADREALVAAFGEPPVIRRVVVERTEDPVTRGIVERLPRLRGYAAAGKPLAEKGGGSALAASLHPSDFSRPLKR